MTLFFCRCCTQDVETSTGSCDPPVLQALHLGVAEDELNGVSPDVVSTSTFTFRHARYLAPSCAVTNPGSQPQICLAPLQGRRMEQGARRCPRAPKRCVCPSRERSAAPAPSAATGSPARGAGPPRREGGRAGGGREGAGEPGEQSRSCLKCLK